MDRNFPSQWSFSSSPTGTTRGQPGCPLVGTWVVTEKQPVVLAIVLHASTKPSSGQWRPIPEWRGCCPLASTCSPSPLELGFSIRVKLEEAVTARWYSLLQRQPYVHRRGSTAQSPLHWRSVVGTRGNKTWGSAAVKRHGSL